MKLVGFFLSSQTGNSTFELFSCRHLHIIQVHWQRGGQKNLHRLVLPCMFILESEKTLENKFKEAEISQGLMTEGD